MRAILVILAVAVIGCQSSDVPTPSNVAVAATPVSTLSPRPTATAVPSAPAVETRSPTPTSTPTTIPTPTASPTLPPTEGLVALPKLSESVAGASKVKYFEVTGDSPNALILDVVKRSEKKCDTDDALACVRLPYSIRWTTLTNRATGACRISTATVGLNPTVYLPRWVRPARVHPALLSWWRKMLDHMAWHEGQHIKIQKTYDTKLKSLMRGRKCASANAIIKKWGKSVDAAQDKFDAKDALWPYPKYEGPGGWYGTL